MLRNNPFSNKNSLFLSVFSRHTVYKNHYALYNLQSMKCMWVHYNQIPLMGRKGRLPDPRFAKEQSDNGRNVVPCLRRRRERRQKRKRWRTPCKAAITGVIHTLRSKERHLSGWLDSWGLSRTSISTKISCKWSRGAVWREEQGNLCWRSTSPRQGSSKTHFTALLVCLD